MAAYSNVSPNHTGDVVSECSASRYACPRSDANKYFLGPYLPPKNRTTTQRELREPALVPADEASFASDPSGTYVVFPAISLEGLP